MSRNPQIHKVDSRWSYQALSVDGNQIDNVRGGFWKRRIDASLIASRSVIGNYGCVFDAC